MMYKSYRSEVDLKLNQTKKKALTAIGIMLLGKMKRLVPVDTGRLKSSLQYDADEEQLYIGSGEVEGAAVYYSTFVEKSQPFIKPSVFNNISSINKLANEIFREEL